MVDVVGALVATGERVDGEVRIVVGLDVPDDYSGTVMVLEGEGVEEKARLLAHFVLQAEALAEGMAAEAEAGCAHVGRAFVLLQDDGSLVVRWVDRATLSERERRFPRAP